MPNKGNSAHALDLRCSKIGLSESYSFAYAGCELGVVKLAMGDKKYL